MSGRFIFRFEHDSGERPKGTPLPLEGCTVRYCIGNDADNDDDSDNESAAFGFVVSTVRKELHLRASSEEERSAWIAAIEGGRLRSIREHLGHSAVDPRYVPVPRYVLPPCGALLCAYADSSMPRLLPGTRWETRLGLSWCTSGSTARPKRSHATRELASVRTLFVLLR